VAEFAGTIYARAVQKGEPIVIDDLATMPDRTPVEDAILASGVRTLVVAPLHYQDRVIGTLELGSPQPGDFDSSHLPALHEVLPLFAMAVRRSMEEFNARIQTAIKERFTAIHPVVEWRFRKAVMDGLERTGDSAAAELEPIVFENVYRLYALSDIRGSPAPRERGLPTARPPRPAPCLRGQRDACRRHDLVLPGPRGAGSAGHLPALLREAEDRRCRPPDLRGRLPGRRRALRSALSQEPAHLAAHGRLRHRRPRRPADRRAAGAAAHDAPRPRAARADVDPLPLRREALRRGRCLRHPLRDR